MSAKITAIFPNHLDEVQCDALSADMAAVQEYLDKTDLKLDRSTLYFVALKGLYTHISRKMELTGIFINKYTTPITEFAATIRLTTDDAGMEIAKMKIGLPNEFVGDFQPNQALLLTLTVPVRGLNADKIFEAFQFKSELENIQIVEKAAEEQK